ncbi:DUF1109 domain-containing protein [Methylocystis echinoides]|uniref:DUF1109 domain-containing protein n=1 Tax=Methylocystis echinoides TaxID=29468 RepID=UPI0034278B4B
MKSEELARRLAASAKPVQRLPHPIWRAMMWFVLSLAYAGALVLVMGLRTDLSARIAEPRFVIELSAAVLTSMMAATAAFCSTCPGRPIWERLAPFPFLLVWLASLGEGCWRDWSLHGLQGLAVQSEFSCFWKIVVSSAPPAILILLMVRRGAPIAPYLTTGLATLAAASLIAAAMLLFHQQESSIMVLVWQFGSVIVMSGIAALFGRQVLDWRTVDTPSLE